MLIAYYKTLYIYFLFVDICVNQIYYDLNGCKLPLECSVYAFIYLDYSNVQPFSQKYMKYLYRGIGRDSIVSPLTYCEIKILSQKQSDDSELDTRIQSKLNEYGFSNMHSGNAVENIFFSKEMINVPINSPAWLYLTYVISQVEYKALEYLEPPEKFCDVKCIDQILIAFNYCQNAMACAGYALEYLVYDDLLEYPQLYFTYLFGFLKTYRVLNSDEFCEQKAAHLEPAVYKKSDRSRIELDELIESNVYEWFAWKSLQVVYFNISTISLDKGSYTWEYFQSIKSGAYFNDLIDKDGPKEFCRKKEAQNKNNV
ncbi:Hypothetical protein CINCED_3A010951 [Cinara cedri]|uniref:Uncharacterized protein n=1 Tax=Cinara cedri TaxID=506608 RepID=A0A5E4N9G9_9HEMI|nr:Hypothetical protein CINCED_3A010951 [Cinara cedri]